MFPGHNDCLEHVGAHLDNAIMTPQFSSPENIFADVPERPRTLSQSSLVHRPIAGAHQIRISNYVPPECSDCRLLERYGARRIACRQPVGQRLEPGIYAPAKPMPAIALKKAPDHRPTANVPKSMVPNALIADPAMSIFRASIRSVSVARNGTVTMYPAAPEPASRPASAPDRCHSGIRNAARTEATTTCGSRPPSWATHIAAMTGRAFVRSFTSDYAPVPQPQPALPATLAVSSAAQHASARAMAGPPQHSASAEA